MLLRKTSAARRHPPSCLPAKTNSRLLAFLPALALVTSAAIAETPDNSWSGILGAGPMTFPSYSGGNGSKVWLVPLISAAYGEMVYIEPLRAGAYLWGSADRKMGLGLAVEPRMGFKAGDGQRLAGMATRRDSLEGGPAFDWDLDLFKLSVSLFGDLVNASGGTSGRLYAYRDLPLGERWHMGAYVGVDRMSARVADYFFGVADSEATPARPAFRASATSNPLAGFDGNYRLNDRYSILFGAQFAYLGSGAATSPIVETRRTHVAWLGLGWNL